MLEHQIGDMKMAEDRYLTFALTKGRLADKTLSLLEQVGITCEEMKDKNSRKLVFVNEELKLKFFLAKGPDVPTYVEYGAADIGVTGKDILLEQGSDVYELLDLNIGKCRMAVAAPEGYVEDKNRTLRVATKYVNITKEFYAGRNREIDIIKLNGSIELAPLLGLTDVIVDIVETGSTLRENHLKVIEEFRNISARFIANKTSFKFENAIISDMMTKLGEQIK